MTHRILAALLLLFATCAFAQNERLSIGPNQVEITARHADGTVYAHQVVHNLKTYAGGDFIASAMSTNGTQPAPAQYFAVSSDSTAPAATDTSLASEITTAGLARHQATYAHTSCSGFPCTYTLTYTWTATSAISNVQKAGILNATTSGTLVFENTFSPVTMAINDTLQFTWTITIN